MTSSNDFWARKLAKEQKLNPRVPQAQAQVPSDQPWWRTAPAPTQVQAVSQETVYGQPNQKVMIGDIEITLDANGEYNPRGVSHKRRSGRCPECDSGNFGRGEDTSRAARCFDCGYVEGRSIADSNRPIGISSDAPAQKTRQITTMNVVDNTGKGIGVTTAASGAQPNYHEIRSANEAAGRIQ